MDSNASDVVGVRLKHVHSFQGVVVKHTDLHVILNRGTKREKNIAYLLNKQHHTKGLHQTTPKYKYLKRFSPQTEVTTVSVQTQTLQRKSHRSSDDPVLSRHKLRSSDRKVTHFKGLDKSLEKH